MLLDLMIYGPFTGQTIMIYLFMQQNSMGMKFWAGFPYLFTKQAESPSYFVPPLKMHHIAAGDRLEIGGCEIDVLHQDHGNTNSLGFLFDGKLVILPM